MFSCGNKYLFFAIFLFIIEVWIALFVHDGIIRSYIGDYLVVILLYCALKSIVDTSVEKTALGVLLFSFVVEGLQYLRLVEVLGLQHSRLAKVVLGSSFEWMDLLAYTLGIATVLLLERIAKRAEKEIVRNPHSLPHQCKKTNQ